MKSFCASESSSVTGMASRWPAFYIGFTWLNKQRAIDGKKDVLSVKITHGRSECPAVLMLLAEERK